MKKVRTPQQITVKSGKQTVRSTKAFTGSIIRPKNKMINKDRLKGKTGGSNLSNYILDLMKLS